MVQIEFESVDPPFGWARRLEAGVDPGGGAVRFRGWLGLLAALYKLTGSDASGWRAASAASSTRDDT